MRKKKNPNKIRISPKTHVRKGFYRNVNGKYFWVNPTTVKPKEESFK